MMKFMEEFLRKTIAALTALLIFASAAQAADLSMAYSNAIKDSLPFAIFTDNKWAPDENARFVKLHLYVDDPIMISGVEINHCGKPLNPDMTAFINFDQWILNAETIQGEPTDFFEVVELKDGVRLVVRGEPLEMRSLTINFESNKGFSICGVRLLDANKSTYVLNVPRSVEGIVTASSTAAPQVDFDVLNLFDSRFEHVWASDAKDEAQSLSFKFANVERIEKIRIWNGNQLSAVHCQANGRIKKILLTGDNNYSAEVVLDDKLGHQTIVLPTPFEGKALTMKFVEVFPGNAFKGVSISELRFNDGKSWFMLSPLKKIMADMAANRERFRNAGLDRLVNDSYIGHRLTAEAKIRFRADGSYYLSGWMDDEKEGKSQKYFVLGGYEVVSSSEQLGLKLAVNGLLRTVYTEFGGREYGDCNGCGRDCNSPDDEGGYEVFKGFIHIKKDENGIITLTNQSGKKLPFRDLRISRENRAPVKIKPRMTPEAKAGEVKPAVTKPDEDKPEQKKIMLPKSSEVKNPAQKKIDLKKPDEKPAEVKK